MGDNLSADKVLGMIASLANTDILSTMGWNGTKINGQLEAFAAAVRKPSFIDLLAAWKLLQTYMLETGLTGIVATAEFKKLREQLASQAEFNGPRSILGTLASHQATARYMKISFTGDFRLKTSNDRAAREQFISNNLNNIIHACRMELIAAAVNAPSQQHFLASEAYKHLVSLAGAFVRFTGVVEGMGRPAGSDFTANLLRQLVGKSAVTELLSIRE